ncbi:MAG: complex I subunit 1 family protein [Candidatus Margulisiibacteriota bacterium]
MIMSLFQIFIFPGMLFLLVAGLAAEYIDRNLVARFQNRVGPPWFQPLADIIKLAGKENVTVVGSDLQIFRLMPAIALAATITAFFYIPLWGANALFSFNGDLIVVLYLLIIPSLTFFLGGWYSRSVYSMIGAVRALIQLFAYEVPLFLAILAPALLANTWSLSGLTAFYAAHPGLWLVNLLGFGVALVTLLGKLEKVPFDIAEAETEVVAGPFTEYSGQRLAFLRLTMNVETIVASALLAAVFLPFGLNVYPALGLVIFLIKIFFIVFLVALARSLLARLRLDQMIEFCWKYLAPLAFLQLLLNLIVKGALYR